MHRGGRLPAAAPAAAAAVALVSVFVTAVTAVDLAPPGTSVASWWPAVGIAAALLTLVPRRWLLPTAVAVAVVVAAANAAGGRALLISALFGAVNGVEALIAASVLRRRPGGRARLDNLEDLFRLAWACTAGAVVAATGATAFVTLLTGGDAWQVWRSVLASHGAATLVLLPVALTWRRESPFPGRTPELVAQVGALAVVAYLVLGPEQRLPLAYLPLGLLVWAGLRLGLRTTAWELAALAAYATWATAQGTGPFAATAATSYPELPGTLVQAFVLSAAVMSLPLAITVDQRALLLQRLRTSETLFRSNFTEAVVGMLLLRREGAGLVVAEANDAAVRMLGGGSAADVVGRPLADALADVRALEEALPELEVGQAAGRSAESALVAPLEGRVRLHLAAILEDDDGVLYAAQMRDVAEEHRSRERLREERELLRATLAATGALIVVTTTDGVVVRVNAATTRATGVPEETLLGAPVWTHLASPADERWFRQVTSESTATATAAGEPPPSAELDLPTRHGTTLRVTWTTDVVTDALGRPTHVVVTGTDVTAERAAAGLMSRVMDSDLGTALLALDATGRITQANRAAARLLGLETGADLVGHDLTDLLDPGELSTWAGARGRSPSFAAIAAWAAEAGAGATREWTWRLGDGPSATVSTTLSLVRAAGAGGTGWFCVGRDVTAARRAHDLLVAALEKERDASDRLRALDAAKDDFVSTVSHELRTPVTSIVGYAEMLADGGAGDLDPVQASMLAAIERNGQRLITLADDLLTLSRLESGQHPPALVLLDLRETVRHAESVVASLVAGRWLDVAVDLPDSPVPVLGDPEQLDRVLLNLLGNAVKFTEDGGAVRCTLGTDGVSARLEVADTGIGVPESEVADLFAKFYRSSVAQERAIQGTGLGLSIVASMVAAHGGTVEVESVLGEGSRFTVTLPLAPAGGPGDPAGDPSSDDLPEPAPA